MPTVEKTSIGDGGVHSSGEKTTLKDGVEKDSEKAKKPEIETVNRSAYSDSDLRKRFTKEADQETAGKDLSSTRSESNLSRVNVHLQLPSQYDGSETGNSGGSGLQIVPAYRDLVSEDSVGTVRDIALAENVKEKDHLDEERGLYNTFYNRLLSGQEAERKVM